MVHPGLKKIFCNSIIKYQGVVVHDLQELGICPKTQCHLFVKFSGICSPSKSLQLSRQPKRNDLGRNGLAAQTSPACSQSTIASCRREAGLRCCQFVGLFEIAEGLKGPSKKRLQNLMILSSQRPRAKVASLCQVDKATALRLHYPLMATQTNIYTYDLSCIKLCKRCHEQKLLSEPIHNHPKQIYACRKSAI